jgi:amino acid transporter
MGHHGLFHSATAEAHADNKTPHVAVTLMAIIAFAVPAICTINRVATLDLFGDVGTCAAFGFMVAYFFISIAAPAYLKSVGELKPRDIAGSIASIGLLIVPAVGSVYPVPAAPAIYFPYVFLTYLAVGSIWIAAFYRRSPNAGSRIRSDLESSHRRFQAAMVRDEERASRSGAQV